MATITKHRSFIRHWKEHYRKGMPLIFIRDMRLDAERSVKAGDPVTPELRAELGEHRMKIWWAAKRVGCPQKSVPAVRLVAKAPVKAPVKAPATAKKS